MRILIYISLMVAAINAQPLDVTQVFNKKTVKVVKKEVNLLKTYVDFMLFFQKVNALYCH